MKILRLIGVVLGLMCAFLIAHLARGREAFGLVDAQAPSGREAVKGATEGLVVPDKAVAIRDLVGNVSPAFAGLPGIIAAGVLAPTPPRLFGAPR